MNFFCPNCTCQLASITSGKDISLPSHLYLGIRCLKCKANWKFIIATGKATYKTDAELKEKPPAVDNLP